MAKDYLHSTQSEYENHTSIFDRPVVQTTNSEDLTNTGTFDQNIRGIVISFGRGIEERAPIKQDGITKVLEYLNAHDNGNVSLADMAAIAGATPHHFASMFTRTMGLSPHQYVLRKRLERAKTLLRDRGLSIAEVSKLTGFQTHEHFTKVFRRIVGITPKEFREDVLTREKPHGPQ